MQLVARLALGKSNAVYTPGETGGQTAALLYAQLNALLAKGDICTAENLLQGKLCQGDEEYFLLALDFYSRLNQLSDAQLEAANFCREEIDEGVRYVAGQCGLLLA